MSDPIKILTIVGARPQFVKASVISRALKSYPAFQEIVVHTGQHFADRMSSVFFDELGMPAPKYDLGINSLSHGAMTGRMLESLEEVILSEDPALVLVYGDTNSTLAGALAAKKVHKKVAHVEAGLRSFDMRMPEEINRVVTDRISDLLYCPSKKSLKNLQNEGFSNLPCRIVESGDVMFDAVRYHRKQAYLSEKTAWELPEALSDFVVCTVHRAENTDDVLRLRNIVRALEEIHQKVPVVLSVHPRTRKKMHEMSIEPDLWLIEPVGYLEMLYLLERCRMVLTDSGGLQKEAFFMKKCCLTLRDTTEWTELVEQSVNFLVGADRERIVQTFRECLNRRFDFNISPYGNGKAGDIIAADLARSLSLRRDRRHEERIRSADLIAQDEKNQYAEKGHEREFDS